MRSRRFRCLSFRIAAGVGSRLQPGLHIPGRNWDVEPECATDDRGCWSKVAAAGLAPLPSTSLRTTSGTAGGPPIFGTALVGLLGCLMLGPGRTGES
jgi:hypothetical protein